MNRNLRKGLIIALCSLLVLGIGAVGYYAYLKNKVNSGLEENSVDALPTVSGVPSDSPSASPTGLPTPSGPQDAENILVIGSDDRGGDEGARSDTMMIIHVNKDRSKISGVSVPRDLMVEDMPSCTAWNPVSREPVGETHTFGKYTMSNAAFAVGGPQCAVTAAEHISGLKMTRYIEVDFNGFESLVNAVGGVQINICKPMVDSNLGVMFDTPGVYNVDGKKALDFARARHVEGDSGSDTSRMARQQYLLKQIFAQKAKPSLLMNPGRVNALIESFTNNTRTDNVDADFLQDMAFAIRDNGTSSIEMTTVPATSWDQDPNRLKDDPQATRQLFQDIVSGSDDVHVEETTTPTETPGSPGPSPSSDTSTEVPSPTTGKVSDTTSEIPCGWG